MKNKNLKKHITDGLLIVFSVLFALTINKVADNYQTEKRKEIALESIKKELIKNSGIIKEWKAKHIKIREKLSKMLEGKNDSLKSKLIHNNYFDFGLLTDNENLINSLLTNTAWETAKSTGIISEFDFETTQELTDTYVLQKIITDKSIMRILDFIFNMEANKKENIDAILIQFNLRFGELIGQEYSMEYLYEKAIKNIK
jgi:hypothetical protein